MPNVSFWLKADFELPSDLRLLYPRKRTWPNPAETLDFFQNAKMGANLLLGIGHALHGRSEGLVEARHTPVTIYAIICAYSGMVLECDKARKTPKPL